MLAGIVRKNRQVLGRALPSLLAVLVPIAPTGVDGHIRGAEHLGELDAVLEVSEAPLRVEGLSGSVLPRIHHVLRTQGAHGESAGLDLAAKLVGLEIPRVVQRHVRLGRPKLDGFEAKALLSIKEVIERPHDVVNVHAGDLLATQTGCGSA